MNVKLNNRIPSQPANDALAATENQRSKMSRLRRVGTFVAALVTAIVAPLALTATPANAQIYAGGGNFGPYVTPSVVRCAYEVYASNGYLSITAPAPRVWAANNHAGANNDSAWIRYRVFLVNANTGATVTSTGYSGYAKATDVSEATFTGSAPKLSGGWRGNYYLDYRIEWWNSTSMIAWVADRVTKYNYYNQYNVGPYGPFSSCYRV